MTQSYIPLDEFPTDYSSEEDSGAPSAPSAPTPSRPPHEATGARTNPDPTSSPRGQAGSRSRSSSHPPGRGDRRRRKEPPAAQPRSRSSPHRRGEQAAELEPDYDDDDADEGRTRAPDVPISPDRDRPPSQPRPDRGLPELRAGHKENQPTALPSGDSRNRHSVPAAFSYLPSGKGFPLAKRSGEASPSDADEAGDSPTNIDSESGISANASVATARDSETSPKPHRPQQPAERDNARADVRGSLNDANTSFDDVRGQEDLAELEFLDNDIILEHLETRFNGQQPYVSEPEFCPRNLPATKNTKSSSK